MSVTLWDELALPWRACLEEAWTAYRAGSLPIGSALVDGTGRVVGAGRNRIFETDAELPEARCLYGHRLAHAEINALICTDHSRVDVKNCALYTTLEPCPLCVGAVRMLGIKEIHYAARDPAAGGLALIHATGFMRRGGIRVERLGCADLEGALIAMHTASLLSIHPQLQAIDRWAAAGLPGVQLGRELSASGDLRRMADIVGLSIDEVIDQLARMNREREKEQRPSVRASRGDEASPLVLVLIGAPASGKSTVGRQLAAALSLPYLSKDLFKECLFDTLGWDDRARSQQLGGASMALLFKSTAALLEARQSVVLDSTFYAPLHEPQLRALAERYGCQFVQVLCTAPGPTLVERFEQRVLSGERHPGHADGPSLEVWRTRLLTDQWHALNLDGPVLTVDTANGRVDVDELVRIIRAI